MGLVGAGNWGTYAEYVKIPERFVVKDETGLTAEEVATLPMVIVTGVRALKVGNVKAGDRVVILGYVSGQMPILSSRIVLKGGDSDALILVIKLPK